jgi:hypothetical protein
VPKNNQIGKTAAPKFTIVHSLAENGWNAAWQVTYYATEIGINSNETFDATFHSEKTTYHTIVLFGKWL